MKKIFKKIALYFSLIIVILTFFHIFNLKVIDKYELLTVKKDSNKLILGASRTETAINDNLLNNSINVSGAGDPLFYTWLKLKIFTKTNKHIDTVILSLDSRTLNNQIANHFYRSASIEDKLPRYLTYLSVNDINNISKINLKSSIKSIFYLPSYSVKLLKELVTQPKNMMNHRIGGFKENKRVINNEVISDFLNQKADYNYKLSEIEIQNLSNIVEYCKNNKLELIFINPPLHPVMLESKEYQEGKLIFEEYLNKNFSEHDYLDYSSFYLPDSCYADLVHLNINGAGVFTNELNQYLKTSNSLK